MAENDTYQNSNASNENLDTAGWHSPTQGGITTPIAPEGGMAAFPGTMNSSEDYGLTTPTAPEGGIPSYSGDMDSSDRRNDRDRRMDNYDREMNDRDRGMGDYDRGMNDRDRRMGDRDRDRRMNDRNRRPGNNWQPSFSGNSGSCSSCIPLPSVPVIPGLPIMPGTRYGQVRFINASTNNFPVTFSIDGTNYAVNSRFGTVSAYQQVSDGFHTVSVRRSAGIQALLLQQTFPFSAGQKVTMVLTDSSEGGLQMIQVADTGCSNVPSGYGCYRVANVSYSGSSFDVNLYNGDTVFRNVSFNEVTSYKRGMAGNYTFYLTSTSFYSVMRELPVIILGAITGNSSVSSPLASGNVTIQAGQNTTTYIMGNTWSSYGLRMVTVND